MSANLLGPFTLGDVLEPVQRALRLVNTDDLKLAVRRIDHQHRELCALTDWPALRAVHEVAAADGSTIEIAGALGVSAVEDGDGAPYWFCERWDVPAGDLAGRLLWSPSTPALSAGALPDEVALDVWDWNASTGVHVPASGMVLQVYVWRTPPALISGAGVYAVDSALALPETRALVVRSVLDLVGLMDRRDVDVAPWRQELEGAMEALLARNPRAAGRALRLGSGRILSRSPLR